MKKLQLENLATAQKLAGWLAATGCDALLLDAALSDDALAYSTAQEMVNGLNRRVARFVDHALQLCREDRLLRPYIEDAGEFWGDLDNASIVRILSDKGPGHPCNELHQQFVTCVETLYIDDQRRHARKMGNLLQLESSDVPAISDRTRHLLLQMGVRYVAELTRWTAEDVMNTKSMGQTTLQEIQELLHWYGFSLKEG